MEIVGIKRGRKRKRNRRYINSKQCYDQIKFEVKAEKSEIINQNISLKKQKLISNTMNASAFWENYKAAHEWQNIHNITWWKTRCFALEHENYILKESIKNLIQNQNYKKNLTQIYQNKVLSNTKNTKLDDIEFNINENIMDFLTQSIQHKIELRSQKNFEENYENKFEKLVEGGLEWVHKRNEDAKLLYGKASSKVLAMETALQTTIERHIDKVKPQYWPNIPLRL